MSSFQRLSLGDKGISATNTKLFLPVFFEYKLQLLILEQYKFISFRKEFRKKHKDAFKNFDFGYGNPLDFNVLDPTDNEDTDKVMEIKKTAIKDWKQVIKNSKKTFGITEKITYTPLYITGAVLAALIAVGINDMYKSFTEKPNEFLKS